MKFLPLFPSIGCVICVMLFFSTASAQSSASATPAQQQAKPQAGDADFGLDAEPDDPVTATNTDPAKAEEAAWQMLETATQDTKPQSRIDALSALGTLSGNKKAEGLAIDALKDRDVDVRLASVAAMSNMQDLNTIPQLRIALDDPAPEVDFAAAVALWKMHDQTGINVLYEVLAGERKASSSLAASGMHEANKDLHSPATLAKIGARQGAYALLGPFGIGLDAARMMHKGSDVNSARVLTATLLSDDKSEATKQEFIGALQDKNYFVRSAAARSLGGFPGKDVTGALLTAFGDPKPSVRYMAAASYIRSLHPGPLPVKPAKPARRAKKNLPKRSQ